MVQTQSREIDGHSIVVTQLPARRAVKLLRRVLKALAPALGEAAGPVLAATSSQGMRGLGGLDVAELGGALERLFANLDDEALDAIVFDPANGALATARFDGQEFLPMLDAKIGGNLVLLGKIVGFALEVHFASFFDAMRGATAQGENKVSA